MKLSLLSACILMAFAASSIAYEEVELIAPVFATKAERTSVNAELAKAGIRGAEQEFCHRHLKDLAEAFNVTPATAESVAKIKRLIQFDCTNPLLFPKDYETLLKSKAVQPE